MMLRWVLLVLLNNGNPPIVTERFYSMSSCVIAAKWFESHEEKNIVLGTFCFEDRPQ